MAYKYGLPCIRYWATLRYGGPFFGLLGFPSHAPKVRIPGPRQCPRRTSQSLGLCLMQKPEEPDWACPTQYTTSTGRTDMKHCSDTVPLLCINIFIYILILHYITSLRIALHCLALRCVALHCIALHCITLQYSTVQYSTVQYSTVQYSTVQYRTVPYRTVPYRTVQYSTVQYSTVKYSTGQYSIVHYITYVRTYIHKPITYIHTYVCVLHTYSAYMPLHIHILECVYPLDRRVAGRGLPRFWDLIQVSDFRKDTVGLHTHIYLYIYIYTTSLGFGFAASGNDASAMPSSIGCCN